MSAIRFSFFSALFLCACSSTPHTPAPIVDKTQANNQATPSSTTTPSQTKYNAAGEDTATSYVVKAGDGLYRIALEHGIAYKDLAAWNAITDPNSLKVGQILRLSPAGAPQTNSGVEVSPLVDATSVEKTQSTTSKPSSNTTKKYPRSVKEGFTGQTASAIESQAEGEKVVVKQQNTNTSENKANIKPSTPAASATKVENTDKTSPTEVSTSTVGNTTATIWGAPTAGKVIAPFTVERKGIDIAGQMGQPIVASGGGKVVYAGTGLRGYGKMIIIQHTDGYLSAYAHNSKLIAKENDVVKKGEKIAEMGNTDSDQVKLHFELRKFGKPVDPSNYIKLN